MKCWCWTSEREELIEQCPQQRDVCKSSYGPLEMSEFKKYLTGDNDTEQKNINDGAAILTATFTGDDNDGIAVQKSTVKDDISNVVGRNSGDEERVENSNSVQKSGAEDDIANAEVDIGNAAGRNSRDTKYRRTASLVKSAVLLLTNCTLWQAMQICTGVQQVFCIRLNSSKIHSSNNNVAACAAPFIPLRPSQLQVQCTYQLPQPRIQYPLSIE